MARKRSNGEGSIHRLPSGSWQTQIMDGYKPDGTRKFKTITAPTQSALKKQKLEILSQLLDFLVLVHYFQKCSLIAVLD